MKIFLFVCIFTFFSLTATLKQKEQAEGKKVDIDEIGKQKAKLTAISEEHKKLVKTVKEPIPERMLMRVSTRKNSRLRKLVKKFTEEELGVKGKKKEDKDKPVEKKKPRKLFFRTIARWFGWGRRRSDPAAERRKREAERKRREAERKRRELEAKRKRLFHNNFYYIVSAYPILYRYKTQYCNARCYRWGWCYYTRDPYMCANCHSKCHWYMETYAKPKQSYITHDELRWYKYFHKYKRKCGRFRDTIYATCRAENYRYGRYNWYQVNRCSREGIKGAYVMCSVANYAPQHYTVNLYYRAYWGLRPTRWCPSCKFDSLTWCSNNCGTNKKCNQDCKPLAFMACLAHCREHKRHYFKELFAKKTRQLLYKMHEYCSTCDSFCYYEGYGTCVNYSVNCFVNFLHTCKHECKMMKCPAYKRQYYHDLKVLEERRRYFLEKTGDEFKRIKNKQAQRSFYDDKKLEKLGDLVNRYNRDSMYDSILIMEGSLYEEQRKMVAELSADTKAQEDLFMSRVLEAYISEEDLAKSDDEIKIFSEYLF